MSHDNVGVVREMHEQMTGVNLAAPPHDPEEGRAMLEQVYAPHVEVTWSATNPEARTYRGYDGLMRAFAEWTTAFEEYYIDATDFISLGDYVVVPTHQRGKGSGSGAVVDLEAVILYKLNDGKITLHREYDSLEEALEHARTDRQPFDPDFGKPLP